MSVRTKAALSSFHRAKLVALVSTLGAVASVGAGAGCTSESNGGGGNTAQTAAPNAATHTLDYANGGFESSTGATITSWVETSYTSTGIANFPPQTFSDLALGMGSPDGDAPTDHTSSVTAAVPQSVLASGLTAGATLKYPFIGADSAAINIAGNNHSANLLEQTFTVASSDIDPSDGLVHVRFVTAPVLQDATSSGHTGPQQPYFFVELLSGTASIFHTYNFANQSGVTWIADPNEASNLTYYTNWTAFDVAPGSGAFRLGDVIDTKLVGAGCYAQAHFGELYADAFSTTSFPVPLVQATAPAYANLGTNITYTITAKNPTASPQTGVTVDFTLPYLVGTKTGTATPASTQTTLVTPTLPAGTSCTTPSPAPAVQKITCTLPSLSARSSESFPITVTIPAAFPTGDTAPYTINEGTYDIHTTQNVAPLNGSIVTTTVGTNTPVDLHATLTDGTLTVGSGTADTYTFTVTNNGANAVTNSAITDTQGANFAITACSAVVTTNCGWTCTATGAGTSCGAAKSANGVTTVNTTATFGVGGTVTYTVFAKSSGATGSLSTYTLAAGIPTGSSETVPFNNVASDTDYVTGTTFAFTATKSGNGDGLLTANPGNLRCDVGCTAGLSASYGQSEQISVWAIPALGDTFAGWTSGPCNGTTTIPCTTTVTAVTAMNAKFVAPTVATSIASTTNGTSTTLVRPGDSETATFTITVPAGENAPLVITDTLGTGLTLTSATAPATTNAPTCSTSATCAPAVATNGSVNTWDFGIVTCTNPNGCTLTITETASVGTGATPVRDDKLTQTIAATGGGSAVATTTVIEPNVTVSHTESTTTAVAPGTTETISVKVDNTTGSSNSSAYGIVVTSPYPTGTTAGNFQAGTCTGATATGLGTGSATTKVTVTFPAMTAFSSAATCTYTYDLVVATADAAGSLSVGADTATSHSNATATNRTYTATDTALTITVKYPVLHACTGATDCLDGICDATNNKCGYANGDGPCTVASEATVCQNGSCGANLLCKAAAKCGSDGDCQTTEFCNTAAGAGNGTCTAKLDNGTAIPTIANHSPALTGACTTPTGAGTVGSSVCASGICDTADNKCGLPEGTLPGTLTCTATSECRAGVCITTGATNAGLCEPCADDTTCSGTTAVCNTTTNQCVSCTSANATACTGATPICDTTANNCTACNGDNGSTASLACPSATPFCTTSGSSAGTCSATCLTDAECSTGNWCDAGMCTPKLKNGTPVPTVAGHAPALSGTCTTDAATAVCASGVCDSTSNTCGYNLGDGPCAATTQCTTGTCITSGTNAMKCESCADDSMCGGMTPVCNPGTNSCAQCNATNDSQCAGVTPVCNTTTDSCTACTGDFGATTSAACPKSAPTCNLSTGACGNSCQTDAECGASDWCNGGSCVVKLANGTPIPAVGGHMPALSGMCTTAAATAVCASGACDPKTNDCGYASGDGPCVDNSQCIIGSCDVSGSTRVCNPTAAPEITDNDVTVLGGGCSVSTTNDNDASTGVVFGSTLAALGLVFGRARRRTSDRAGKGKERARS